MRVRLRLDRLQQLLARSALSQNHWAIRVGLSRGHWADLVNGRHAYPSARTRQLMMEALGASFEELFEVEPTASTPEETELRSAIRDRYLVDREIGQGAMGSVYLARDVARGRLVALKTISSEASSDVGVEAILREISATAQLQHPNIVPLFDSGTHRGQAWLVMPWIREGSLRERLRRDGRLTPVTAARIVSGMAAALGHAHADRVLHCDVKPENILLQGDHPYLTDFGISRALHLEVSEYRARGKLDTSAGTPAYVSPEQASGEHTLGPRSDIYSMACVAFEMLAGRPPFEGSTTLEVVSRRFHGLVPDVRSLNPEVWPELADVLKRGMALDPARRPETADQFAVEFCEAAERGRMRRVRPGWGWARRVVAAAQAIGGRLTERPARHPLVAGVGQDLRHGLRALRRSPRYAFAAMVPLALGLGAGTTFLSLVDHLMFRPRVGVEQPDQVSRIVVETKRADGTSFVNNSLTWIDLEVLRREGRAFSGVAAFFSRRTPLGKGNDGGSVIATYATGTFFSVLGAPMQVGRAFQDAEDVLGAAEVPCVVSDRWARARYDAPARALGVRLEVPGLTCVVSGVAVPGFKGIDLGEVDLWIPIRAGAPAFQGVAPELWTTDGSAWVRLVARRRSGVSLEAASVDATRAYRSFPTRSRDRKLEGIMRAEPIHLARGTTQNGPARQGVLLAWGAGALLLLVVANLVNAALARDVGRYRELAIRQALGGGAYRLWRAHVVEGVLIAFGGTGLALLITRWLAPIVRVNLLSTIAWTPPAVDARVVGMTLGVALTIGGLVSGFTAWRARRRDAGTLLRGVGAARGRGQVVMRLGLVAVQAAVSLILVVASVAFVRSFQRVTSVDVGFQPTGLLVAQLGLPLAVSSADKAQIIDRIRESLRSIPEVGSIAQGYMIPWANNNTRALFSVRGDSMPPVPLWGSPLLDLVSEEYATTVGLQLREGRWFTGADGAGSEPVVVVSQALVRLYWGDAGRAVGECLRLGEAMAPCRRIIGVVHDYRMAGALGEPPLPVLLLPDGQRGDLGTDRNLFIRTEGAVSGVAEQVRRVVQGGLPPEARAVVRDVSSYIEPMVVSYRLGAIAFTALGVVAVTVALVGLYAVLAFSVAERRQEFAIRAALGGSVAAVARPVVRQAMGTVGLGLVAGLMAVWLGRDLIAAQLFEVTLADPLVLVLAGVALLLLGWAASSRPARAGGRADPMDALRGE